MIDKNIGLNDPLTNYMDQIAIHHCPDIDPDDDGNMCAFPSLRATFTFIDRYNNGNLYKSFNYEDYISNKNIQNTLSGLNLDIDKFWILLLYIYDYSCCICFSTIGFGETGNDQLTTLLKGIKEFDCNESTITLSRKGKKIIIDNSKAVSYLFSLLEREIDIANNDINMRSFTRFITPKYKSDSVLMWFFTKIFNSFFTMNPEIKGKSKDTSVSYSKLLLISRLIYFTKLTTNENFINSDDSLKGIIKQYKDYKISTMNNIYR